ncbi:MAG: hypothetical protein Q8942_04960 [Bacillota bacterium]|nr:hypothetical protein [Bacillota bacterium]
MFYFRRIRRNRKSSIRYDNLINEAGPQNQVPIESTFREDDKGKQISAEEKFALHISRYIGQTITVFVCGGGPSGAGFTGVLSNVGRNYIKLISSIGPPPACSLRKGGYIPYYLSNIPYIGNYSIAKSRRVYNLGSITYIPVNKITSFVHNSIDSLP